MSLNDRRLTKELSPMRPTLIASATLIALCVGVGAAAAQTPEGPTTANPTPVTSTEQYGIRVKPAPLELMIAAHAGGLTLPQAIALRDFTGRWMNADRAPITVSAPEHGPDAAGVYRTASAARDYLISQGVPTVAVQIVGYDAGGDPHAPIRISFMHYEAEGPQCGQSWSNLSDTHSNAAYPEFGCALTANMAEQVADAADFLHPRATDPPDAMRRENVIIAYRLPEITATPQDPQANATLSTVGQ
jgi:pilus assembly protein CpaD